MQSPSELGIVNINTLSNPQILDFSKVFAKHKLKSKILPKTICNEFELGDKELAMLCRGQGDTLVIVYANECSAKLFKISKKTIVRLALLRFHLAESGWGLEMSSLPLIKNLIPSDM